MEDSSMISISDRLRVSQVVEVDRRNVEDGFLLQGEAMISGVEAAQSEVGQ
jgi:hypothetical protein